jgi:hypothetical protein
MATCQRSGGMTGARTSTLATLRGRIERIEAQGEAYTPDRVALGHADADATLQGGLAVGAMHEVFAEAGRHSAAATGFVADSQGAQAPGGRWCGCGRISLNLNPARCR